MYVQGTVKATHVNNTKNPKWKLHVFELLLDDGNQVRISTKFTDSGVKKGEYVGIEYQEVPYKDKVNFEGDVKTLVRLEKPANAPVAQVNDVMTKDDYWKGKELKDENREVVIRYHAARASAIEFVRLAHDTGSLPTVAKAKVDQKFDALLDMVNLVTNKFFLATESINVEPDLNDIIVEEADAGV